MRKILGSAAGVVGLLVASGCAPVAEPKGVTDRPLAQDPGWPCGEGVSGVWTAPDGSIHAIIDDGVAGYMLPADAGTVDCARANGLMVPA